MRSARVSPQAARILAMLAPYPWESRQRPSFEGGRVSWPDAYNGQIRAQAQAPGFPAKSRQAIVSAAIAAPSGAGRRRRAPRRPAFTGRAR